MQSVENEALTFQTDGCYETQVSICVIPAQAGIQILFVDEAGWIPAKNLPE